MQQGQAARTLLSYVASLPLKSPDAQLLAVVVAIRSARGGAGNLTSLDVSSMRLTNQHDAAAELRSIGWQLPDELLSGDPETPVAITVPDLTAEEGHPLPFGKNMRTRVSGWSTRTMTAKPVKKTSPAVRLAALFLAAHSSSELDGQIPPDLPDACRTVLRELVDKAFLTELAGDRYRLAPAVAQLAGLLGPPAATTGPAPSSRPAHQAPPPPVREFSADAWAQWKGKASAALRRHAEAVEQCPVCVMPVERVAAAFMEAPAALPFQRSVRIAYGVWKDRCPDRGAMAAEFTVSFRAEHGHGPSYTQLCDGLGWKVPRPLRSFIVKRMLANQWVTDTSPVPWTLRPGPAAHDHGITAPTRPPLAVGPTG